MTLLKFVNVFFFQWFFVRLTRCSEKRIEKFELLSVDLMPDGTMASRGIGNPNVYEWWAIQFWILPCTGWWSKFVFLSKEPRFLKITRPKQK